MKPVISFVHKNIWKEDFEQSLDSSNSVYGESNDDLKSEE